MALDVLPDAGHDESAWAVGLDTEPVAGSDPGRGGDRPWDRYLMVGRHLCPPDGGRIVLNEFRWGRQESNLRRQCLTVYSRRPLTSWILPRR